jgi:hypothetical protein
MGELHWPSVLARERENRRGGGVVVGCSGGWVLSGKKRKRGQSRSVGKMERAGSFKFGPREGKSFGSLEGRRYVWLFGKVPAGKGELSGFS